jgi:hypothetical protein
LGYSDGIEYASHFQSCEGRDNWFDNAPGDSTLHVSVVGMADGPPHWTERKRKGRW